MDVFRYVAPSMERNVIEDVGRIFL